jgi:hypothetical protein
MASSHKRGTFRRYQLTSESVGRYFDLCGREMRSHSGYRSRQGGTDLKVKIQ